MSGATSSSTTCYNCGTPLTGRFCSACGQKAGPLDPTVHDFLHDFSHEMIHVDGRIFRSVWKLLASPGFLTREQFEGRRASWISPIRLYLVFSLLYFAAASLVAAQAVAVEPDDDPQATAFLQRLGFSSPLALRAAVEDARDHWGPRAMFVLVPVFAWLVGLAWRRRGRHYPQQLYFALHVHAAWFAVAALVAVVSLVVPLSVTEYFNDVPLIYGFVYVVFAFRLAYRATLSQSVLRSAAVLLAYSVVVGLVAVGIALAVIFGHREPESALLDRLNDRHDVAFGVLEPRGLVLPGGRDPVDRPEAGHAVLFERHAPGPQLGFFPRREADLLFIEPASTRDV